MPDLKVEPKSYALIAEWDIMACKQYLTTVEAAIDGDCIPSIANFYEIMKVVTRIIELYDEILKNYGVADATS